VVELEEHRALREYAVLADGGTAITAYFPIGDREPDECGLTPGNTLPRDGDAGVVHSSVRRRDGLRLAMVRAHKAEYADELGQTTGTVTGVHAAGATTVTATAEIFYPSLVGNDVAIADTGTFTVASYVSRSAVTVTGDATCADKTITFDEASRLLSESLSDAYRWSRTGRWTATRRWHCLTADRDVEVQRLGATKHQFAADDYSVWGKPADIICRGRDPNYPHRALIEVTYEAPFNPREYPLAKATIEMRTSNDTRRLQQAVSGTYTDIETRPDDDGYYYRPIEGTNEVPAGNPVFILRSAILKADLKADDYQTLAAMKGTINNAACANIGNAAQYELRCLDVATAPHFVHDDDTEAIPVMWIVELRDGGWHQGCKVERRRRYPKAKPVLHPDDDGTGDDRFYLTPGGAKSAANDDSNAVMRTVIQDLAADLKDLPAPAAADDGYRVCYAAAAWTTVNALLSWNAP